ncbi:hypothetical protein [Helicobacter sp. 13S00477-4]|uniref:hypothetical protein n=1 Tax=Helicobacter sp. 13S00477-4 TaxID=1905759 RepID=UPI0015DBA5CB|nr:hypothetical protein [Helicobacter sp. 13S00477-4]
MTYEKFITLCEKSEKQNKQMLYLNNKTSKLSFYEDFMKYCQDNGLNKAVDSSVLEWIKINHTAMIDQLDSFSNERIKIFGSLKDKIQLSTEIKRGNEKAIIPEVLQQITQILGYEPFWHEGGNHIIFKNEKTEEIFYCIEWHFAFELKEQNLIKKTAKELGMTYKELGEAIGVSDTTLASSVSNNKVSAQIEASLNLILENHHLKQQIKAIKSEEFKKDLEEFNQFKTLLQSILSK